VTKALLAALREVGGRDWQSLSRGPIQQPSELPPAELRVGFPILGESVFKEALVRERKRADRFDASFAVLIVDRTDEASDGSPWVGILQAMAAVKRDADAVGWLDEGAVLGLLLPEASRNGAIKVMDRLRQEVSKLLGESALAAVSMRVYAHGVEPGPDGSAFPPVDLLLEAFVSEKTRPWRDAAKRGVDIIGSLAMMALFAPVMLAAFAAVKWSSPGPVLLRQVRIGRRGEPFKMLKFRTMYANAGHAIHQDYMAWFIKSSGHQPHTGNEVFKLTNDPRITRPGRVLRKTSLDELPQFWNVLRGDMSLVGPRPPLPFEVEQYQPWHRRRVLEAKPGITGLWQVSGRSRTTFDDMVRLDLRYARTHTLWTDIKILAATPRAMFKGGA
jgi:lipopolysaccharide/colanic/teichoic acid biosynthesis glycosyltransferase